MNILKRYVEEDEWKETTQEECLRHTEGSGYWVEGSVLPLLAEGQIVHTPFARYKAAQHSVQRMADNGPQPGSLDYWASVTSKNSGDDRRR